MLIVWPDKSLHYKFISLTEQNICFMVFKVGIFRVFYYKYRCLRLLNLLLFWSCIFKSKSFLQRTRKLFLSYFWLSWANIFIFNWLNLLDLPNIGAHSSISLIYKQILRISTLRIKLLSLIFKWYYSLINNLMTMSIG